ncbi:glycosyltransferase [Patescibacteria group bacterium]
MKKDKKILLSIIIPAYKQEKTIKKDLISVEKSISEGLSSDYDYEIICVVDGEVDNTLKEAKKVRSYKLKIYSYKENKGKGYAVRHGMRQAKGDLISFLDSGMDISPKGVMMLLAHMEWYGADIVVGSKRHPVSRVNYPLLRHVLSLGYHLGVRILFGLNITDTQSGLKIFKRQVINKILPRLLVKRYAMDIEMLAVARHLSFKRIYEAPIEVKFDKSTSRIKWSTIFKMAWDTMAVFYRLRILHYYDDSNKQNWISEK